MDYSDLKEKIQAPILNARNVVIRQSLSDQFVNAFKEQVEQNQRYHIDRNTEVCCLSLVFSKLYLTKIIKAFRIGQEWLSLITYFLLACQSWYSVYNKDLLLKQYSKLLTANFKPHFKVDFRHFLGYNLSLDLLYVLTYSTTLLDFMNLARGLGSWGPGGCGPPNSIYGGLEYLSAPPNNKFPVMKEKENAFKENVLKYKYLKLIFPIFEYIGNCI